ncbi:hypothetical protein [Mycolicibacterium anyangense]|nr:hypothetical protein [Mycolicibacterium anyangense]
MDDLDVMLDLGAFFGVRRCRIVQRAVCDVDGDAPAIRHVLDA